MDKEKVNKQEKLEDFKKILLAALVAVRMGNPFLLHPTKRQLEALEAGSEFVETQLDRIEKSKIGSGRPVGTYPDEKLLKQDAASVKKRERQRREREEQRRRNSTA